MARKVKTEAKNNKGVYSVMVERNGPDDDIANMKPKKIQPGNTTVIPRVKKYYVPPGTNTISGKPVPVDETGKGYVKVSPDARPVRRKKSKFFD